MPKQDEPCQGRLPAGLSRHTTVYNFPADGQGHLDTLISTTISVDGHRPSCLVAHFSAMAIPQDNHVVFQVRVDGVPMNGHLSGLFGIATPGVSDPQSDPQGIGLNLPRMVSYTFFAEVTPGRHTVEVLFAGCCSQAPPPNVVAAYAGSPVLVLSYQ